MTTYAATLLYIVLGLLAIILLLFCSVTSSVHSEVHSLGNCAFSFLSLFTTLRYRFYLVDGKLAGTSSIVKAISKLSSCITHVVTAVFVCKVGQHGPLLLHIEQDSDQPCLWLVGHLCTSQTTCWSTGLFGQEQATFLCWTCSCHYRLKEFSSCHTHPLHFLPVISPSSNVLLGRVFSISGMRLPLSDVFRPILLRPILFRTCRSWSINDVWDQKVEIGLAKLMKFAVVMETSKKIETQLTHQNFR